MKKIAVIGDRNFTIGFELAGVSETHNPENYAEEIQQLTGREDVGIVVAEKEDVGNLPNRIEKEVRTSVDPVVVALSEDTDSEKLSERIRKVIGAEIG